jgi:hypothetical protein
VSSALQGLLRGRPSICVRLHVCPVLNTRPLLVVPMTRLNPTKSAGNVDFCTPEAWEGGASERPSRARRLIFLSASGARRAAAHARTWGKEMPRSLGGQTGAEIDGSTDQNLDDRLRPHLLGAGDGRGRSTEVRTDKCGPHETFRAT